MYFCKEENMSHFGKKANDSIEKWKIMNAKKRTVLIFDLLYIVFPWLSMTHGRKFKPFQGINILIPTSHLQSNLQLLPALPPII